MTDFDPLSDPRTAPSDPRTDPRTPPDRGRRRDLAGAARRALLLAPLACALAAAGPARAQLPRPMPAWVANATATPEAAPAMASAGVRAVDPRDDGDIALIATDVDVQVTGVIAQVRTRHTLRNLAGRPRVIRTDAPQPVQLTRLDLADPALIDDDGVDPRSGDTAAALLPFIEAGEPVIGPRIGPGIEPSKPQVATAPGAAAASSNVVTLAPDGEITIELRHTELLVRRAGRYTLAVPRTARATSDTLFSLHARIDAPFAVHDVRSTHGGRVAGDGTGRVTVDVPRSLSHGTRDYELDFALAGARPQAGALELRDAPAGAQHWIVGLVEPARDAAPLRDVRLALRSLEGIDLQQLQLPRVDGEQPLVLVAPVGAGAIAGLRFEAALTDAGQRLGLWQMRETHAVPLDAERLRALANLHALRGTWVARAGGFSPVAAPTRIESASRVVVAAAPF
jgi:hypothetical protein